VGSVVETCGSIGSRGDGQEGSVQEEVYGKCGWPRIGAKVTGQQGSLLHVTGPAR
jgi:hypothetical protein